MRKLCQEKGRSRGMRDSTQVLSRPMLGQNITSCFSNSAPTPAKLQSLALAACRDSLHVLLTACRAVHVKYCGAISGCKRRMINSS